MAMATLPPRQAATPTGRRVDLSAAWWSSPRWAEEKKRIKAELAALEAGITPRKRLRAVVRTLARHGLLHLLQDRKAVKELAGTGPGSPQDQRLRQIGRRVRLAFQELGPTFIKLGQVLVTRQELLPEPITMELAQLLDQVPPMPFPYMAVVLDDELPDGLQTLAWIDPDPIGSASLAQVYRAQLRDGRPCAVKVVRPLVDKLFQTDIANIAKLARRLQKLLPPPMAASSDLPGVIRDYYSSVASELDMRIEARNTKEGRAIVEEFGTLAVPEVYLATRRVLVTEYIDGWNIKDFPVDFFTFEERFERMIDLAHLYIKEFLDGRYHADPHGSNLMVCRHTRKVYVIDWGMVGRMDALHTEAIFRHLLHIRLNQAEDAAEVMLDVFEPTPYTDTGRLKDQLRSLYIQYVDTEQAGSHNWGHLLVEEIRIAMENHCRIPAGLSLWAKGWSAAEGTARWLCPEITYHTVVESADVQILRRLLARRFNYRANAAWIAEASELVATLPRRLNKILERAAWNDFKLPVEGRLSEQATRNLNRMVNRATLGLVSGSFFLGSALLAALGSGALDRIPGLAAVTTTALWGSLGAGVYTVWRVLRSNKA
ncbi:ABC1 kinase family protein [Thermaerobacter subterraneus]|uniref:Unusual protein kinase n=1 Tax=Thermaerobacter subterraneus DSM 13965 TaxID=867903 RepID=K6Q3C7_9FIRM|nr:AarF/UbiB family protein [Thermaerobacter subterraneus]EKP95559.1 putative unusual protein kinase [Thermaerobacter subterraneus DSM 13965]